MGSAASKPAAQQPTPRQLPDWVTPGALKRSVTIVPTHFCPPPDPDGPGIQERPTFSSYFEVPTEDGGSAWEYARVIRRGAQRAGPYVPRRRKARDQGGARGDLQEWVRALERGDAGVRAASLEAPVPKP